MEGNLDFLSAKLSLVSLLDAGVGVLLAVELDEAETTGLAVGELLELERLDRSEFGEVFPQLLLGKFGRQVAHNHIGLLVEAGSAHAHVDGMSVDLSVVHFLLASLGFFWCRKLQEAKSLLALRVGILFDFHFSVENFVPTAFEELQEVKIVKVLWKIADIHRRKGVFLLDCRRALLSLLILSRWMVAFCELLDNLKQIHERLVLLIAVVAWHLLLHLAHLLHLSL